MIPGGYLTGMSHQENANQVFGQLRLAAVVKECVVTDTLYRLDVELLPSLPVAKFLRSLPELQYRLRLPYPIHHQVLAAQGLIRLQAPLAQPTYSFWDYFPKTKHSTHFNLGIQPNGELVSIDMAQNPHLLIAGATGSGKSIALHVMIASSILNGFETYLTDPKLVEFGHYAHFPQVGALTYTAAETLEIVDYLEHTMQERLAFLQKQGCSNYAAYNPEGQIFFFLDEVAHLLEDSPELSAALIRLTQKCRAAGIHLVIATQRPSMEVIPGLLKANFPARIACKTASLADSRVVLDAPGAQNLMGRGDALLTNERHSMLRFQFFSVNHAGLQEALCIQP